MLLDYRFVSLVRRVFYIVCHPSGGSMCLLHSGGFVASCSRRQLHFALALFVKDLLLSARVQKTLCSSPRETDPLLHITI